MAEGFEIYQQQSRRDKVRLVTGCVEDLGLLPVYDPFSSSSTHMLSCANTTTTSTTQSPMKQHQGSSNFTTLLMPAASHSIMGREIVVNNNNNNNNNCCSLDPQPVHDFDNGQCSFVYTNQDFRLIHHHHQPFHGGGDNLVLYKPEALALSLSSHNTHNRNLPLGLNLQRYESAIYGGEDGDFGWSAVSPLGLFTGYASILKGSRFLKPAQQLLEEICDVGFGIYAEKFAVDYGMMMDPPLLESLRTSVDESICGGGDGRKKSRLISMLDEVYKRYKQYHQQVQAVIASFEAVSGLSNVAPFAFMDLRAMSKHFRCLKKAITDQLQFSTKTHEHHINYGKEEAPRSGSYDGGLYGQRPVNNSRFVDHQPVWRPQRGLPERAVTVLRAWLFDHFLHPYPTDTDKLMLAKQTGLSRNQVSNWFINARVRLWKPMVEEIHALETRQLKKASSHIEEQDASPHGNSELPRDKSSTTSPQSIKNPPSKRIRNDSTGDGNNNNHPMAGNEEPMNLYNKFSRYQQLSSANGGSINRGVSLTLGLHQNNNGIALPEPFPLNAARRFGLDASSESFIIGREIIGGQLLHDFVG